MCTSLMRDSGSNTAAIVSFFLCFVIVFNDELFWITISRLVVVVLAVAVVVLPIVVSVAGIEKRRLFVVRYSYRH